MTEQTEIMTPAPIGPHPDSVTDGRLNMRTADGLLNYCPRHRRASAWSDYSRMWLTWGPISIEQFIRLSAAQTNLTGDPEMVKQWLANIAEVERELSGSGLN